MTRGPRAAPARSVLSTRRDSAGGDPRTPGTLYASTSEGLFKSTDEGERWTAIGTGLPSGGAYLRTVAVDPVDSRIVYAAAQRGFWKSVDGGATWTSSMSGLGTDPFVSFAALQPYRAATDGFVAVLDGGGSMLLFSSALRGAGSDTLVTMVPRGREVLISGGSTDLGSMFPDGGANGAGSFVGVLDLPSGVSFMQMLR